MAASEVSTSRSARRRARANRSASRRGWNAAIWTMGLIGIAAWILTSFVIPAFRPAPPPPAPIAITSIQHVPANDEHYSDGQVKLSFHIAFQVNNLRLDASRGEHLVVSTTHNGSTAEYPIAVGASWADISYLPWKGTDSQASARIGVADVNGTITGYMTPSYVFTIPAAQAP